MPRRRYIHCDQCQCLILVSGEPRKGDRSCRHRFSREPCQPTVYFENAQGQRMYTHVLPKEFKGYVRKEVQPGEVRKFERMINREMEVEQARAKEAEALLREGERNRRHAELREMARGQGQFERDFVEEAIRHDSSGYSERPHDFNFRISPYS